MFCKNTSLCWILACLFTIKVFANEKLADNKNIETEKSDNVSLSKTFVQNATETSNVLTQKPIKPTAAEVDDLLHGGEFKNLTHQVEKQPEINSYSENDEKFTNNGKWDIELIEDGSNTEDDRIKKFVKAFHNSQNSEENYDLVTILVISVIVVVIAGYGAYYSWRKLDDRCKKREVLINEVDPDDMRHFSI